MVWTANTFSDVMQMMILAGNIASTLGRYSWFADTLNKAQLDIEMYQSTMAKYEKTQEHPQHEFQGIKTMSVIFPDGAKGEEIVIEPGETVLVSGPSGCG